MGPFDLGALGFWIFVAACVVSSDWKDSRIQAQKHETLRRIVDKTGAIDEAKMKELFSASSSDVRKPGPILKRIDRHRLIRSEQRRQTDAREHLEVVAQVP